MNVTVEILGIIASIIIVVSMTFRSTSAKANILMRTINIIGSIIFIIYGFMIPAYSTALLNCASVFINAYNIYVELRILMRESIEEDY